MFQLLQRSSQLLFIPFLSIQGGICDYHPYIDNLRCLGMLRVNPFFLYGDEDRDIQRKTLLLGISLHDGFPLSIIGYGLYISNLIHRSGDLLISLGKHIS